MKWEIIIGLHNNLVKNKILKKKNKIQYMILYMENIRYGL
jgi:hypothetical protein